MGRSRIGMARRGERFKMGESQELSNQPDFVTSSRESLLNHRKWLYAQDLDESDGL